MMSHSSVERLLADLHKQDIRVWVDDGRLRCAGPDLALTPEVIEAIRARKADILAFLNDNVPQPASTEAIAPRNSPNPPLSFAQQRLLFIEQMLPGTALYHIPLVIEARGQLDRSALASALEKVVEHHAVLRTRIAGQGDNAHQTIAAETRIPVLHIDRSDVSLGDAELEALINGEARRPFDLSRDPPMRLSVIALSPNHNLLLFTLHHIAGDGWSLDVLLKDFAAFYTQAVLGNDDGLPPLPIQYGDFAAWQREHLKGAELERALSFWTSHLGAPLPVTQLPTDFSRPRVQRNQGAVFDFEMDVQTVAGLRAVASAHGATLFATLFTAFNVLLYRYVGQADLVVGTPVANRRHPETENLVGLFVNPLAIRTALTPGAGFGENLRQVQAMLWQAFEHQDLPFEQVVEKFQPDRNLSMHPIFQTKFQLDSAPGERIELPGLELKRLQRHNGTTKLDLSLDLREAGDIIRGCFEYDVALFRSETIEALADNFATLVAAIAADPARPIAGLPLLSTTQKRRQLVDWNETGQDYDRSGCFQKLFQQHAFENPEATALVYAADGKVVSQTYGALNRRANQLAHALRRGGVGPEVVVGIALDRGPDMIAAWLAVLKAGGAYLPLDPAYPAERIAYMLGDSGAGLVLTNSHNGLPAGVERLDLDLSWPVDEPTNDPECVTLPDHLAYVIYTSGSTGRPKGVLVQHGGLVNLTADKIRTCDVRPGDCVLQFFSFSFDASIPELVMSLAAGAKLLLAPAADVLPGPGLAALMREQGVTHVTMTPSALLGLPAGDFPHLRMVLVGGEAPSPELIARWSAGRLFINAYGPTETTVNASMVACGDGRPSDATLWPAANKQLYVLDETMEPLPVGVPGELYIGGDGLARGYHRRPDLTAAHFLPDPFAALGTTGVLYRTGDRACQLPDGRIRILGRLDDQVKIRGYRIELGEIEAAVLAHPEVVSVVIVPRENNPGDKRLVAYAAARNATRPSTSEMRQWLAERLPRFFVPEAFVWLDVLPMTVNGKVDLARLPEPDFARRESGRAPDGELEIALASVFRSVLGVENVSADDDFFELGGHSLLATRLAATAREQFGIDLAILDIFNAPTVSALAERVAKRVAPEQAIVASDDDWRRDIVLASEVRPTGPVSVTMPARRVLLTGATGFLGSYLLHELLRDTDREVYCLVRGEGGAGRIQAALESYDLWTPTIAGRVHAIPGDLSAPKLGLSDQHYAELAAGIEAIFHNGAEVHHMLPYQRLRAANVHGTEGVLQLACAGGGRPLHFISSLSALSIAARTDRLPVLETDDIAGFPAPAGGYNRTKWVAEQLVAEAGRRGLPVAVYRPGSISGDSQTGAFNSADILCRQMQGYIRSGMAPEGDPGLNILPVDYVAQAIVHLADAPDHAGRIYHLAHSRPVSSDVLFEACAAEGLTVQRVPYGDWYKTLTDIASNDPDHPLYALIGLFEARPAPSGSGSASIQSPFDRSLTHAALANAAFDEPALDQALFRKYLRAFVKAGAAKPRPPENKIMDQNHD